MAILYVWSGAAGSASGADWANAKLTLTAAFTTEVAGDTIYVAHDHNESTASAVTLTSSGTVSNVTKVICVNRAGTVPPVAADRRATAQVATSGTNNLTITGVAHYDGIIFSAGTGSSSSAHIVCHTAASTWLRFDNCSMRFPITGASGGSFYANGTAGSLGGTYTELNNTTMVFNSAGAGILFCGALKWRNTPTALSGSALPGTLFTPVTGAARGGSIECIGVDLSALGSGKTIVNIAGTNQGPRFRLIDCKLDAAVTKANVPLVGQGSELEFIRSGATGNYTVYRTQVAGTLDQETTIVRTGGASDGTTPIAWKIVTTANCFYSMPFECPPIAIWCDTTGSAVTATVEGIWGGGAVPNDDDVWLDVEYLGDASSPQGSFVNDGKPDLITAAAAQTSSAASWGGSTTKFKLAATFTPQQKGWIYARVKCAKASSTFYIDPLVTLT